MATAGAGAGGALERLLSRASGREQRPARRVGVLALQGGYARHAAALHDLGHQVVEVRYAEQLDPAGELRGLVLPGGESTTMLKLIDHAGLRQPLERFVAAGHPILATCAGVILSARAVSHPEQDSFGWLDIAVQRNGWGRQLDSFQSTDDSGSLPLLFIRAPRITEVGPDAEVLATLNGEPIMVRQGALVGATFHPELTESRAVHRAVFGGQVAEPNDAGLRAGGSSETDS